jgi:hypothetical protein
MKITWHSKQDLVGPLPTWPTEVVAMAATTTTLVAINAKEDEAQVGVIIPPIKYARELATPQISDGIASIKNMFLKRELQMLPQEDMVVTTTGTLTLVLQITSPAI